MPSWVPAQLTGATVTSAGPSQVWRSEGLGRHGAVGREPMGTELCEHRAQVLPPALGLLSPTPMAWPVCPGLSSDQVTLVPSRRPLEPLREGLSSAPGSRRGHAQTRLQGPEAGTYDDMGGPGGTGQARGGPRGTGQARGGPRVRVTWIHQESAGKQLQGPWVEGGTGPSSLGGVQA